jgi:lipopolysaccharide heptosyltransferase II
MAGRISMKALQRADKTLGLAACVALQPLKLVRERPVESPAKKVLAIKFWGIGSLQLLTPAIRTLRKRHPFAEISFLTLSDNREFAERLRVFDRVLTLDVVHGGWAGVVLRIARLLRGLRRERFDAVYDFEFFTRFSSVVALVTGAPKRHGFESPRAWRGSFHTEVSLFNRYWHVTRNFRVLAGGENGRNPTAEDVAPIQYGEKDEARAAALLERRGLKEGAAFAVLNPNAGELSLERRWPAPRFIELAQRLISSEGWSVVLIGSKAEREYTEGIAHRVGSPRCVNLAGELDVSELVYVLSRANVVVTNDSGPMHVAATIGAPTLGLFGPETPVMYGPLGLRARALYRPPSCSPCINVHDNKVASCIYGEPQCLMAIGVDEVHEAARALASGVDFGLEPFRKRPPSPPSKGGRIDERAS